MTYEASAEALNAVHHQLYAGPWGSKQWMGVPIQKLPEDLFRYQQIIWEKKPSHIIETGTYDGGSALFFAHMLDLAGIDGLVVSVDIDGSRARPSHPKIRYVTGSSVDGEVLRAVNCLVSLKGGECLVSLDSDHSCRHVLEEMILYRHFVPVGGSLVVEDTDVSGHPIAWSGGPGPWEAVEEYLRSHQDFQIDHETERAWPITFHPRGWLRRVA